MDCQGSSIAFFWPQRYIVYWEKKVFIEFQEIKLKKELDVSGSKPKKGIVFSSPHFDEICLSQKFRSKIARYTVYWLHAYFQTLQPVIYDPPAPQFNIRLNLKQSAESFLSLRHLIS